MWKLKANKGFTLIEVLCSIAVFSILFTTALTISADSLKLKRYSFRVKQYSAFMEKLKNNMLYNATYEELQTLIEEEKYYIVEEKIKEENLKDGSVKDLFTSSKPLKEPYVALSVEGDKVLKISLKLYSKDFNREKVWECEFYKGKYKR